MHDSSKTSQALLEEISVLRQQIIQLQQAEERYRQTEKSLRESEELYTKLVDTIPDVIVRTDLEGRILFINDYAFQINGYRRDEIEGQNILQYIAPEEQNRAVENLALMLEGKTVPHEYHLVAKDGKMISFEINGNLLRDEKGNPQGVVVVCREITERKKAQEALQQSEEQYRRIAENMSDLVCEVDDHSIIRYASPSHLRILGYAQEELLGRAVYEYVCPDDLERMITEGGRRVRSGEVREMEYRYRHKDGHYVWMRSIGYSLRNEKGDHIGSVISSSDITERKLAEDALRISEERYRTILDEMEEGYQEVDLIGTITFVNEAFLRIFGYEREEVIGRHFSLCVGLEDMSQKISAAYVEMSRTGIPIKGLEFDILQKDGTRRTVELYGTLLRNDADQVIGFRAMERDITDRRRADREKVKLQEQLLQAQKMESVGRLAGGVAHDFNNMLSVIIGNAQMAMMKMKPDDPFFKVLQDILNAGQRSSDLTRQLLAFARKQAVSPRVLDLNETITSMLKMLRRLIGEDIDLVWHAGHNLWKVKIDPSQVDQLLANFMVNARDAIEKTGKIMIETSNTVCDAAYCQDRPECRPGDYVVLAVSDDGCGMDQEIMASIFEPFFTTKKEGMGTGLGLATVYGIVKQNGGFVYTYSEPGQGTTFRVYLPRYTGESAETGEEEPQPEPRGGAETILIVEDEPTVLNITRGMLEALGYKILSASGKDQALEIARTYQGKIDLLLTDVVMPDINGKELSGQMLTMKPDLKCLYMSGYTADVIARQGILEEGIQFISKPFSLKDLAAKVREALE